VSALGGGCLVALDVPTHPSTAMLVHRHNHARYHPYHARYHPYHARCHPYRARYHPYRACRIDEYFKLFILVVMGILVVRKHTKMQRGVVGSEGPLPGYLYPTLAKDCNATRRLVTHNKVKEVAVQVSEPTSTGEWAGGAHCGWRERQACHHFRCTVAAATLLNARPTLQCPRLQKDTARDTGATWDTGALEDRR
jgi:hypothetical protein